MLGGIILIVNNLFLIGPFFVINWDCGVIDSVMFMVMNILLYIIVGCWHVIEVKYADLVLLHYFASQLTLVELKVFSFRSEVHVKNLFVLVVSAPIDVVHLRLTSLQLKLDETGAAETNQVSHFVVKLQVLNEWQILLFSHGNTPWTELANVLLALYSTQESLAILLFVINNVYLVKFRLIIFSFLW